MAYNILIVDDSKSMRKVIRKIIGLSGFKVGEYWEAENGQEALTLLKENWVDLILSDFHMPVMNGLELLRHLKQDESLRDVPVVFITTESNENRLQELLTLGARGCIRKPFHPEEIRAYLAKIMGESDEAGMAVSDEECDF